MSINVKSEIGRLQTVMLHRPGVELEFLVPESLERLLFDDIPFLQKAQQEHDYFTDTLRNQGIEVVYLENLVTEVLNLGNGIREEFIEDYIKTSNAEVYSQPIREYLNSIKDNKELILKTISGITLKELDIKSEHPLVNLLHQSPQFATDSIPNLYFSRDTFASIGNGVSINRMYSKTRRRESLYANYIFNYHPKYKAVPQYFNSDSYYHIEGGDILNLSSKVLAVGISQRTQAEGIEQLALNIFKDETSEIEIVLAFEIPNTRAFMHLDTVFTQIDHDTFVLHPEIINSLRTYALTFKGGKLHVEELNSTLDKVLARALERDSVKLIHCGGVDRVASAREQWNDGSNTLCIEPGKVVVYDRNTVTNKLFEDNGIEILKIQSSELSRGRGGPRCMTMPLKRENINIDK